MWNYSNFNLKQINELSAGTMAQSLGIIFTELGDRYLIATMKISENNRQPYGLLHGGASAALAETLGSVASWLSIDPAEHMAVGLEINCNHIRGKKEGTVTGKATPLHLGRTTHVWDIKITDEGDHMIAVSRLTVAIIKKKPTPVASQ